MKWISTCIVASMAIGLCNSAPASLFNLRGSCKSGNCGEGCGIENCGPVISRPGYRTVFNYQRKYTGSCGQSSCITDGDCCERSCSAPSCCAPGCCAPCLPNCSAAGCSTPTCCAPACNAPMVCGTICEPSCCAAACNAPACCAPTTCGPICDPSCCAPTCNAPATCGSICDPSCCVPSCNARSSCGSSCSTCSCGNDCHSTEACQVIATLIHKSMTGCYATERRSAIHRLGDHFDCCCHPEIMNAFIHALNDSDERVRAKAADEIGDQVRRNRCICGPPVIRALRCALADCDRGVRRQAEQSLKLCGFSIVDACHSDGCSGGYCPAEMGTVTNQVWSTTTNSTPIPDSSSDAPALQSTETPVPTAPPTVPMESGPAESEAASESARKAITYEAAPERAPSPPSAPMPAPAPTPEPQSSSGYRLNDMFRSPTRTLSTAHLNAEQIQ